MAKYEFLKIQDTDEASRDMIEVTSADRDFQSSQYLWQDRSPSFYKIYEHCRRGEPYVYGGYLLEGERRKMIACSYQFPLAVHWPDEQQKFYYETDLYVHPQYRGMQVAFRLMQVMARSLKTVKVGECGFAIENVRGLFRLLPAFFWFLRMGFTEIGETSVYDIYLTEQIPEPTSDAQDVVVLKLRDMSQSDLRLLAENINWYHQKHWLYPKVDLQVLERLIDLDPEAEFFGVKNRETETNSVHRWQAATISVDTKAGRRFVWKSVEHIVLTRLRLRMKGSRFPLEVGGLFATRFLGLVFCDTGAEIQLKRVLARAYQRAYDEGYHAVFVRDVDEQLLPGNRRDFKKHTRRIFLHYWLDDLRVRELIADKKFRVANMDSLFL